MFVALPYSQIQNLSQHCLFLQLPHTTHGRSFGSLSQLGGAQGATLLHNVACKLSLVEYSSVSNTIHYSAVAIYHLNRVQLSWVRLILVTWIGIVVEKNRLTNISIISIHTFNTFDTISLRFMATRFIFSRHLCSLVTGNLISFWQTMHSLGLKSPLKLWLITWSC